MSLKPKVVEFDTEWSKIRRVLDQVLSGQKVNKADWMDRFLYENYFLKFKFIFSIHQFFCNKVYHV